MIVRIVKMKFQLGYQQDFELLFEKVQPVISKFDGCMQVKLLKDANDDCTYFTYSIWQSEKHLNHYRFSEFFKDTWTATKKLFAAKAEAWSLEEVKING